MGKSSTEFEEFEKATQVSFPNRTPNLVSRKLCLVFPPFFSGTAAPE